ncbi:F-box/kelch-repeat protein [Cardamine amara subsp. amara]|uniref:F-box/kelch-repeat protein n=1 Tax=Cardamine amara subsp. amara TaxID=228776 RepID=A0ABD1C5H7_CARAN
MKSTREPPNESIPPAQPPSPSWFSSLPEDIVLSILARISTLYYPKLTLVSKSFCSLILSKELQHVRFLLGTRENCVYVRFQSVTHPCDYRWYSLWIKPDDHQTLPYPCNRRWLTTFPIKPDDHQTLTYWTSEDKSTGNLLVPMPSSYSPHLPRCYELLGSDVYVIGGENMPSSNVWVFSKRINIGCKAPSMMTARKNGLTCPYDGKIYVIGGCEACESTYWAEVFDPKTQTWEPLPDPGTELRFSSIKKIEAKQGKVYVWSNKKNFVYLIEESRWEVFEGNLDGWGVKVENICYSYACEKCWWYDTKCQEWRLVKGLTGLDRHFRIGHGVELGSHRRKLVIFWVGLADYPLFDTPEIWCAVILLEKSHDGEVWGQIEWVDVVLKVPYPHTLLRWVESLEHHYWGRQ